MTQLGSQPAAIEEQGILLVDHFLRGRIVEGGAVRHSSRDLDVDFATPELNLNDLVTPRAEPPPLLDVPLEEKLSAF